ncbi:MAG: ribonuclease protein component [Chthoniobacter sp.]|jgi:ribonuclease P protein component|nr:ribonuclease protein component [Chthoniobacter sp.]
MARLRFPQSARLSRASEFARLRREGLSFHGKLMVLSFLKAEPDLETRIGLITSRRVGGAVVRNRVRRRLREIVRALRPRLQRGIWLVLIARQSAAKATFQALRDDCLQLAQRSAILPSECS